MSVVITTYTLASGIMQQGMNWWQAMITILLGNTIVLVPMVLNAHAGTKYGVSFPVLCRAAFGVKGRQRAGDPARHRGVRMVRHSDVDRRARAARVDDGSVDGLGGAAGQHLDRVRGVLADAGARSSCAGSRAFACSKAGRRRSCWAAGWRCCGGRVSAGGGFGRILAESSGCAAGRRRSGRCSRPR